MTTEILPAKKNREINSVSPLTNVSLHMFFIIISALCTMPLLLVIIVSFTSEEALSQFGYSFVPAQITLDAYRYVFDQPHKILSAYGITIFTTVVGTVLSLLMTAMIAYALSRKVLRYRGFLTFLVFFPMLFNGGLVPWYILWTKFFHMKNNLWMLIIPYLLSSVNVLIMRTFFVSSVPDSLIESAKIDGAGEYRIFFQIVFPLALPAFATIGLFVSLGYWNDWWLNLIFIDKDNLSNLQFLMYKVMLNIEFLTNQRMVSFYDSDAISRIPTETVRMAMAVIGIGPIVLAYPFFQKYIIKGLTLGAIKG